MARLPATAGTGGGAYRSFQGQEHLPLRDHHVRNGHADIVRERIDGVTGS